MAACERCRQRNANESMQVSSSHRITSEAQGAGRSFLDYFFISDLQPDLWHGDSVPYLP
jgi:hypothetical protein